MFETINGCAPFNYCIMFTYEMVNNFPNKYYLWLSKLRYSQITSKTFAELSQSSCESLARYRQGHVLNCSLQMLLVKALGFSSAKRKAAILKQLNWILSGPWLDLRFLSTKKLRTELTTNDSPGIVSHSVSRLIPSIQYNIKFSLHRIE